MLLAPVTRPPAWPGRMPSIGLASDCRPYRRPGESPTSSSARPSLCRFAASQRLDDRGDVASTDREQCVPSRSVRDWGGTIRRYLVARVVDLPVQGAAAVALPLRRRCQGSGAEISDVYAGRLNAWVIRRRKRRGLRRLPAARARGQQVAGKRTAASAAKCGGDDTYRNVCSQSGGGAGAASWRNALPRSAATAAG